MRRQNWTWLWLIPLLLFATWIASRSLNIPLWFDEYISIYNAGGAFYGPLSPAGVLERIASEDPWQSPGYYLALSGWGMVMGWSEYGGRVFSLLLGLLVIAWAYRVGREWISPTGGLTAAFTLGTSAFYLNYMYEMRGYTLYPLLTLIAVWAYLRLINRWQPPTFIVQAAFVLSVSGLFYTHYFASLTVVALGLWHLLFVAKNRRWWQVAGLMMLSGVLFLPWINVALNIALTARDNPTNVRHLSMTDREAVESLLRMFSNGSLALLGMIALFSLRDITVGRRGKADDVSGRGLPRSYNRVHFVGTRLASSDTAHRMMLFVWFWFGMALLLSLLVNHLIGVLFAVRHLMGLFPALALIAGIGIDRLGRAGVKPAYILVIWFAAGVWIVFDPAAHAEIRQPYTHLHWNDLASALRGHVQPEDRVVFLLPHPADEPMHRMVSEYYLHDLPGSYRMLLSPEILEESYVERARDLIDSAPRLFVAYDTEQPARHRDDFDQVLIEDYTLCGSLENTGQVHVGVYAPNDDRPAAARFGEGIETAALLPFPALIEDTLSVLLRWQIPPDIPPDTYSVSLHVVDNVSGQLAAQADYPLPARANACRSTDLVLEHLPPGGYDLLLIVYNWQTGERLPGMSLNVPEQTDSVLLTRFEKP